MTVYRAANPRHIRQFDTADFWWLEDAWSEKSMQWWTSPDDTKGRRVTALIQFASRMQQSGIPELSPTAEWLAEAIQRHPAIKVELDPTLSHLPLAYQVAKAYEKVEEEKVGYGSTTQDEFLNLADPAFILASSMELTEEMFEGGRLFRTPNGRRGIPKLPGNRNTFRSMISPIVRGMLRNPQLPGFDNTASGGELSTWRSVLVQTYRGEKDYNIGALVSASDLLLQNLGATEEDLLFAVDMVWESRMYDKERDVERISPWSLQSHGGVASKVGVILESVVKHPNFVSHPGLDELYPPSEAIVAGRMSALPVTAKPALSDAPEEWRHSLSRRADGDFIQPRDSLEAVCETILNTPEEQVRTWHLNLLKKYMSEVVEVNKYEPNKLSLLSESACLMGSTLAGIDEAVGELSGEVPLEWILEMLGS